MSMLFIRKDELGQGAIQTEEQIGVFRTNDYHDYGFIGDSDLPLTGRFTQAGYIRYTFFPLMGGSKQMGSNYLVTTSIKDFIKTRAANTSLAKYEKADVAKWLIAAGGVNMLIADTKRAIKSYNLGNNDSRQKKKAGIETVIPFKEAGSMNANDDIANVIKNFNRIIKKLSGIKAPKKVPFIDYWYKLCTNVYNEEDSMKSQSFYFSPSHIPVWDLNGLWGDPGDIVYRPLGTNNSKNDLTTMINLLNTIADIYTTDDTISNMFAEFEKADNSEVYDVTPLTEDDYNKGTNFVVDVELTAAIKNASIVPVSYTEISQFKIKQATSSTGGAVLRYNSNELDDTLAFSGVIDPAKSHIADFYNNKYSDRIYSCYKDNMSNMDNFNALQFTTLTKRVGSDKIQEIISAGLIVITAMQIVTAGMYNTVQDVFELTSTKFWDADHTTAEVFYDLLYTGNTGDLALLQFTAIPVIQFCNGALTQANLRCYTLIDDCDNTITINNSIVEKIHDAINMSLVMKD